MGNQCVCCHRQEGEQNGDHITVLADVDIISKFNVPIGAPTSIRLCTLCIGAMPINISALMAMVNRQVDKSVADDVLLGELIRRYIIEVWPKDIAPSYEELCDILNGIGLLTTRNGKWTYHNLRQKLRNITIDREAILGERNAATFHERMQRLMRSATIYTAGLFRAQLEEQITTHDPHEFDTLPADMPGQRQSI